MANMASNASNANKKTPVVKGGPQEEQQLEEMLDRLDQVHLQASLPCPEGVVVSGLTPQMQLRQLRSALPRMLEPLMAKHASRKWSRSGRPQPTDTTTPAQAAFAAYMQSVDGTNKEIASFQEAVHGLQTDGLFAKASASQKANPKGLKQWRASEHPDWASPDRKRRRDS